MDTLTTLGNLTLMVAIIASGILFITVNINYTPDADDDEQAKELIRIHEENNPEDDNNKV